MADWGVLGTVEPHWGFLSDLDREGLGIWAGTSGRDETRESKIGGAVDRARCAEGTLGNSVVGGVELELEGISNFGGGDVGAECQTSFSDLDDNGLCCESG